jgi:hypothetical protein
MKTDLNLKSIQRKLNKIFSAERRHGAFIGIIIVLLAYLFMVWKISTLAVAEPTPEQSALAETQIPKIDKKAIDQIQSLEKSNTEIRSLFDEARNNPFQE